MVTDVMASNGLVVDDFISVIFTATSDLVAEFPAYAARRLGFGEVPLLCARELEIAGSMPRVVRMMAHVETDLPRSDITHVYLHGAAALRKRPQPACGRSPMSEPVTLEGPVLVVGAGLLGTSIGLALRRRGVAVWFRDMSTENLRTALGLGAGQLSPDIAPPPQLVVVAVPPNVIGETRAGRSPTTRRPWSPTSAASRPDLSSSCAPTGWPGCRGTSAGTRWPAASGRGRWRPARPCSTGARGRSRRTRTPAGGRRPGARAGRGVWGDRRCRCRPTSTTGPSPGPRTSRTCSRAWSPAGWPRHRPGHLGPLGPGRPLRHPRRGRATPALASRSSGPTRRPSCTCWARYAEHSDARSSRSLEGPTQAELDQILAQGVAGTEAIPGKDSSDCAVRTVSTGHRPWPQRPSASPDDLNWPAAPRPRTGTGWC